MSLKKIRKKMKKDSSLTPTMKLLPIIEKNRVKKVFMKPMSGNHKRNMEKKPMSNVGGS